MTALEPDTRTFAAPDPGSAVLLPPPPFRHEVDVSAIVPAVGRAFSPAAATDDGGGANRSWTRFIAPIGVGALGLAACAYTALHDPNTSTGIFPQCTFKQLTGLDCPGCGLTRAAYSLMHGDLFGMANHNLLAVLIFPVFAYVYVTWFARLIGFSVPHIRLARWQGWAVLIFVLTFWVVRNLPGPLHFLDSLA